MAKKVLIVEDSMTIRKALLNFLNKAGFETFEAKNGQEGLDTFCFIAIFVDTLNKEKPDILITDLVMAEYDGFYLLDNIKDYVPEKVVVLTSDMQNSTRERIYAYDLPISMENKPLKKEKIVRMLGLENEGES